MIAATPTATGIYDTIQAGEKIVVVDLFCGAGGMSSGAIRVLRRIANDVGKPVEEIAEVIAVNHWDRAIETHKANHEWATHFESAIQELRPTDIVADERTGLEDGATVHLLIGCPDCTYFSPARGGGPKDPDSRATPREILDWVERLDVRNVLFENVPEFADWGPLDDNNEVIDEQKGEYFDNWINALTIEGFNVEWRILNAANYGDATSRRRLFVAGRKDSGVAWPEQTHSEDEQKTGTKSWRTAADIIDWEDPGESVWVRDLEDGRRNPLKNTTMQRIAEGIRRHGHELLEPFADVVADIGRDEVYDLRERIVPAEDAATVAMAVDDPFLVTYPGQSATEQKVTLCTPYLLGQQSGGRPRSVTTGAVPTVSTSGAISMIDPRTFVLPKNGKQRGLFSNRSYPADERPVHTIVSGRIDQGYAITPYLVPFYGERKNQRPRTHSVADPQPTIPASAIKQGLTQPYLVEYYGNGRAQSLDAPVPTIPTKDRFALVVPEMFPLGIDILFRMLKPSELAAAMGFEDYTFTGNKTETVKQIGNAVPVNLAESLCEQLLVGSSPTLETYTDSVEGGVKADD